MEYRISIFNKILRVIFGTLAFAAGIALFIVPLNPQGIKTTFQFGLGITLLLLGFYLILDAFSKLLTIDETGITLKGLFIKRTFTYNEIKGFRITTGKSRFLIIVPVANNSKSIRVSSDFEKFKEIQDAVKAKVTDLDEQIYQQENEQILSNEDFGASNDEREANRKKAKRVCLVLISLSGLLIFIVLVLSIYEIFLVPVVLLLLVAAFYSIAHFKGLIQIFDTNGKSAYSLIWPAILLPVGAFWAIAVLNVGTISDYSNFWNPAIIIFFATAIILYKVCEKTLAIANSKYASIIVLIIFLGTFSYSTTIFTDKYFDNSVAKNYDVIVQDKSVSVSSKGHKSYWLSLPAWGTISYQKQYKISKALYYKVYPDDTVHIILKEGKLGIPWYTIAP